MLHTCVALIVNMFDNIFESPQRPRVADNIKIKSGNVMLSFEILA